jgi:TPR repeat protein
MDIKQRARRALIATGAVIVMTVAANASGPQQDGSGTPSASTLIAQATAQAGIPHDVPKAAAQAMQLAQKWHSDAQMIDVRVRETNNYALEFDFKSPSDRSTFYVQSIKGQFTSQVMPPVTTSATNGPLPLEFLDLPAAIAQAEQQGMPHVIKEASLQTSGRKSMPLVWAIQPETDDEPYLYTINAATGAASSAGQAPSSADPTNALSGQRAPQAESSSALAPGVVEPVMASGLLQQCLGITRGGDRMARGPATQQYCKQLPGANLFDQAGERFQAGDHAGAAEIVRKAADAGNAVAQLRLALMYDQGDGVPRSAKAAFAWYARAAAQGEPESQKQMGIYYEGGEGVQENWDLAAKFYQASALQGWLKGQFSFGRAYQFGIGVPQDRQQAIAWYKKSAAQGDPDADHWAKWLSDFTNNIGFRDDVERSIVMDVAGRLRFSGILSGGDPAGVTFHSSAQRALWLAGQRERVDKDEVDTFRRIRQADHEACLRAGRDNC